MSTRFTDEVDTYTVLILKLKDYCFRNLKLPEGMAFARSVDYNRLRSEEKRLLQQIFDDWDIPFYRRLKGFREDSPILVVQNYQLIGGVYLCNRNEFDDGDFGQLHYSYLDPKGRDKGIYSVIFQELVRRAREWGLEAIYINTDRYLLPEVYMRWGAKHSHVLKKTSPSIFKKYVLIIAPGLRRWRRQVRLLRKKVMK